MKLFDERLPWYKANLHTHTTNSDGLATPEEAERIYKEAGYSVLALTEHRKLSPGKTEPNFLIFPATELNVIYCENPAMQEHYHLVALDVTDPSVCKYEMSAHPQEIIDKITAAGGLAILAHPQWSLDQPERVASLKGLTAVEVYNSVSGFPWNSERANSAHLLDLVSARGTYLPQVASDDTHFYTGEQCKAFTMIQPEEFSREGIKKALKEGRFYASMGPTVQQVEVTETTVTVTCSECVAAIFYSNTPWVRDRSKNCPDGATVFTYEINPQDRFLRIELIDKNRKSAWISPMAVNRKEL